ncbi:Uncharacterised protein [Mycobacteroides abscessus]|nr:Uncharacterised protein [Mycobacteroides abscessus]
MRVVTTGFGDHAVGSKGRLAVTLHAFRVGPVHREPGEELGGHATTTAAVVVSAAATGACRLRLTQLVEQLRVLPYLIKPIVGHHIAGKEPIMDRERASVYTTHRVDQAHYPARAAHVEPRQTTGPVSIGREVEEGVAREHPLAIAHQPVV